MIVHCPDSGFSSISIASSTKQAITPIGITHTASDLEVQIQQERLVSHKQTFSSWADGGIARHTSTTSAHPRKHQPCENPLQQRAEPQPQAQAQELTAGYIAGGSTNEIHALSRTETQVAAHKYTNTLYFIALFTLGFSHNVKSFYPGNLKAIGSLTLAFL